MIDCTYCTSKSVHLYKSQLGDAKGHACARDVGPRLEGASAASEHVWHHRQSLAWRRRRGRWGRGVWGGCVVCVCGGVGGGGGGDGGRGEKGSCGGVRHTVRTAPAALQPRQQRVGPQRNEARRSVAAGPRVEPLPSSSAGVPATHVALATAAAGAWPPATRARCYAHARAQALLGNG